MVLVNFSVSSQGGNSCNHEHEEEILFAVRGGDDLAKIYFRAGICHHSDFFIS